MAPARPGHWPASVTAGVRHEAHFGHRVVRCFADRPSSFYGMFLETVARHPEREALVAGARRWRWRELEIEVGRFASGLRAHGLRAGDRIALFLSNRPEFVVALLASQRLGAITVPIGIREQRPGLTYMLGQCGARAVVFDAELSARIPDAQDLPDLALRVIVGSGAGPAGGSWVAWQSLPLDESPAPIQVAEEDTAVILYTSGTTGHPKGAMLSHLGIVHSTLHFQRGFGLGPDDRAMLAVPASHVTGLVALIGAMIRAGGALVMMSEFKAGPFLALMAAERVSYTILVPAMYALCTLQPDFGDHDLARWRVAGFGGAPMPEVTIAELARRLPGLQLANAYGATETTSPATMMPLGQNDTHRESVGVPLPCADLLVVDDDGCEVPAGQPGEIWIGGPMVVQGYWDNPQASHDGFVGGYWRSGDIGLIDDEGYVRVFDRKKDMINRGGYKIYSVEVENTLVAYPGVIEAAVVGRPCPVLGERVDAHVHGPGCAADEATLRAFCATRLADYKVPERIVFRPEPLPRNANGKLLKRLLRDAS